MKQINSDQIVDNGISENAVKPIPRDLADVASKGTGKSGLGFSNFAESYNNGGFISEPNTGGNPVSMPLPDTPQLVGIKSQNVKIKEDGTYAVDVIIEVEDIRNVSDYEVRISKGAGSI